MVVGNGPDAGLLRRRLSTAVLTGLAARPDLRAEMGRRARVSAEHRTWTAIGHELFAR